MTSDNERAIEAFHRLTIGIMNKAAYDDEFKLVMAALQRDDSVVEEMAMHLKNLIYLCENYPVVIVEKDAKDCLEKFNASRGKV